MDQIVTMLLAAEPHRKRAEKDEDEDETKTGGPKTVTLTTMKTYTATPTASISKATSKTSSNKKTQETSTKTSTETDDKSTSTTASTTTTTETTTAVTAATQTPSSDANAIGDSPPSGSKGMQLAAIIGGAVVGVALIGVLVWWLIRRRRRNRRQLQDEDYDWDDDDGDHDRGGDGDFNSVRRSDTDSTANTSRTGDNDQDDYDTDYDSDNDSHKGLKYDEKKMAYHSAYAADHDEEKLMGGGGGLGLPPPQRLRSSRHGPSQSPSPPSSPSSSRGPSRTDTGNTSISSRSSSASSIGSFSSRRSKKSHTKPLIAPLGSAAAAAAPSFEETPLYASYPYFDSHSQPYDPDVAPRMSATTRKSPLAPPSSSYQPPSCISEPTSPELASATASRSNPAIYVVSPMSSPMSQLSQPLSSPSPILSACEFSPAPWRPVQKEPTTANNHHHHHHHHHHYQQQQQPTSHSIAQVLHPKKSKEPVEQPWDLPALHSYRPPGAFPLDDDTATTTTPHAKVKTVAAQHKTPSATTAVNSSRAASSPMRLSYPDISLDLHEPTPLRPVSMLPSTNTLEVRALAPGAPPIRRPRSASPAPLALAASSAANVTMRRSRSTQNRFARANGPDRPSSSAGARAGDNSRLTSPYANSEYYGSIIGNDDDDDDDEMPSGDEATTPLTQPVVVPSALVPGGGKFGQKRYLG